MSHRPIEKRLNIRFESRRIRRDPLLHFLNRAFVYSKFGCPRERYEYSYYLYSRSMERVLEQISTAVRYQKGPYYTRSSGRKFGPGQKKLADKARKLRPFLELDVSTCLLHTRILLDRVVALSRVFLTGPKLPNFNSFSDHKKFFIRNPSAVPGHDEYASYMRENTDWFDIPIKYVRDKFFVHQGPRHFMMYTIGWEKDDNLTLRIMLMPQKKGDNIEWITFNPWRMSYDVEDFLDWFCSYGLNKYQANVDDPGERHLI